LGRFGHRISEATVRRILRRRHRPTASRPPASLRVDDGVQPLHLQAGNPRQMVEGPEHRVPTTKGPWISIFHRGGASRRRSPLTT
jgi:hypothetical protein